MSAMLPDVTVLLNVYNGEDFLAESIESILTQDYSDFEFIIINDGSTDSTPAIIEEYMRRDPRIHAIHQANTGISRALNQGMAVARGNYIVKQDADDISMPNRIRTQLSFMKHHPDLCMVGAWAEIIDEHSAQIGIGRMPCSNTAIHWSLLFRNCIFHSAVLFDKRAILSHGGYNVNNPYVHDYELWLRLISSERMAQIPEILVKYRRHSKSWSTIHHEGFLHQENLELLRDNLSQFLKRTISFDEVRAVDDALDRKVMSKQALAVAIALFRESYRKFIAHYGSSPGIDEVKVAYLWNLIRMMSIHPVSMKAVRTIAGHLLTGMPWTAYREISHFIDMYLKG